MADHIFLVTQNGRTMVLWDGSPELPPAKVLEFLKANCRQASISEFLMVYDTRRPDWVKVWASVAQYLARGVMPKVVSQFQLMARHNELMHVTKTNIQQTTTGIQVNKQKTSEKAYQATMSVLKG